MAMTQCGLFNNCNGSCEFCLIHADHFFSLEEIYKEIDKLEENIKYISTQENNYTNFFSHGISILGGEIFFLQDETYKQKMLHIADVIVEYVLKVSPNPQVRFSTVTNGNYDPNWLLFPFIDRIVDQMGSAEYVDVNFSYDFKYRFKSEAHAKRVRDTINAFHDRYNYETGVQMILTQNVIDMALKDGWNPVQWIEENLPGNKLSFLYPHPINRGNGYTGGKNLEGFNFKREDLFKFLIYLHDIDPSCYEAFVSSVRNSAIFKYTMLYDKGLENASEQKPVLSDGKEVINPDCGHSVLYQCYSDCDNCLQCDLEVFSI